MPQLRQFNHIRTLFISLVTAMIANNAMALEEPTYQVEKVWEAEQIEIRAYAPRIMAVTGMDDSNGGFRVLAGYIFGGNAEEEKIAMTAPVQQSMAGEKEMAFMMPAEYALEDLPEPEDQRVSFRTAPAHTAAVIQFSGWASAEKSDKNWQQLRRFLIAKDIDITGEPTLNQYNPPWTLPFMRRNEIIVPVAFPFTAMN